MLKLYILYISLGFYMLYNSLMLWAFPVEEAVLQTYMAMIASLLMYFIVPIICLYKPRSAPGWGLACLAGITPFGMHLLEYRLTDEYFNMWSTENIMLYASVLWYLITLIVTINIFTQRYNLKVTYYSNTAKFLLAVLPFIVIIVLGGYFVSTLPD